MRIAPVLLPHLRNPSPALWADTALAAMLTHNDSASTAACLAFVRLLWELLGRDTPPAPEWWLDRYLETARALELEKSYAPRGGAYPDFRGPLWRYVEEVVPPAWAEGLDVLAAGRRWYSGAYLLETVPSVLYVLMRHGEDPEAAVVGLAPTRRRLASRELRRCPAAIRHLIHVKCERGGWSPLAAS
jgi:ADP-ribosylglycohydrolase